MSGNARITSYLAALFVSAAILFGGGGARAQMANPGQVPFRNWLSYLQAAPQNYTVTAGTAVTFPGCTIFVTYLGSCFGNNSATPYIIINPPPSSTNNLPSYIQSYLSNGSSPHQTYDFWQLDINEALVVIVTLPPPAAFFSYQSYMFERPANNPTYSFDPAPSVPTPPGHCMAGSNYMPNTTNHTLTYDCQYDVFGFFTNAINNADIESAYNPPFNDPSASPATYSTVAFITSPNSTLTANLMTAFTHLGYNANLLFSEPMPSAVPSMSPPGTLPLLYPGVLTSSDIYASLIRYAVPGSATAGPAWLASPASNVLVSRVKEPSSGAGDTLFSSSGFNVPGYNTDEVANATAPCPTTGTYQSYACDLTEISNLLMSWTAVHHSTETYAAVPAIGGSTPAPGCIMNGTPCGGGTQDNSAYRKLNIGTLGAYEAFFVGVNHSSSAGDTSPSSSPINNADYTGVSAAIELTNTGVTDVTQANVTSTALSPTPSENLSGSAAAVLSLLGLTPSARLSPDLPNLYISVFCRAPGMASTCAAPFTAAQSYLTTIVSSPMVVGNYIPPSSPVLLVERGYKLPATTGLPLPSSALTGANPFHTQNPLIVCDTAGGGSC